MYREIENQRISRRRQPFRQLALVITGNKQQGTHG